VKQPAEEPAAPVATGDPYDMFGDEEPAVAPAAAVRSPLMLAALIPLNFVLLNKSRFVCSNARLPPRTGERKTPWTRRDTTTYSTAS